MPYIVLENVTENKKFKIKNNPVLIYKKIAGVETMPIPTLDENDTQLMKLQGTEGRISLESVLVTDTEDLSMGTNSPQIKNIFDQINYLATYFVKGAIGRTYRITVTDGSTIYFTRDGIISEISIQMNAGEGETSKFRMEFIVGTVNF